ncbi:MAG: ParM/StbA family protein [Melioribacteraceae bacterium]|nr:ParM/StbA family protein [Melioribacteraceae bacterium]MCF8263763.1 ParM/StbA family protein [Melioribacteraceae bacterium]MCF8412783.1 ParM/StbA family protein [Melioribacteraceae bacterium]MCF8430636.1 ParM/StbA family protein [Melioribacteraceae bacterium]
MNVQIFPSILEKHDQELKNIFRDLISGLRIHHNGEKYVVGQLALTEGVSPHKIINSYPSDTDFQVLMKAALLLASAKTEGPINLTLGFPYSTYMINREEAIQFLSGKQEISYDQFSIGKSISKTVTVEVDSVDVTPEIIGCGSAVRAEMQTSDNVFVANLGYGTFEACLTNETGIVDRTVISAQGLHYAIHDSMAELKRKYYLGMKNDHQYDFNFQKGFVFLNRKKVDLTGMRKKSLTKYYNELISPTIRNTWKDADFENTEKLVIAGGGAFYQDLVDLFKEEFGSFLKVEIFQNPHEAVAKGYCSQSKKKAGTGNTAVGVDLGNAQTVVVTSNDLGMM